MCDVAKTISFTSNRQRVRMSAATILEDISEALESWSQRILAIETKIERTRDLRENIVNTLQRQVLDGLISEQDSFELEYVADLWINLYKTFLCHSIGTEFTDRDVFTYLLELFGLKQISKDFFIRVALQLCRVENEH